MVMVAQCLPNELVRHWDEISLLIIFDGDADVSIIKICVNQPWKSMEISATEFAAFMENHADLWFLGIYAAGYGNMEVPQK